MIPFFAAGNEKHGRKEVGIAKTLVFKLLVCVAVCLAVGGLGSLWTSAGVKSWYPSLVKPAFTPPGWLFGPVWTGLYVLMGVAAALVWQKVGWNAALGLFVAQLVLNALWSLLFFRLQSPLLGLIGIVALWAVLLAAVIAFARIERVAGWLLVPYLLWVSFAAVLNAAIFWLNR
jgi:tryptophan-rich sensory protein